MFDLSSTIQCPNQLKAIIKNQVGQEEIMTLQYALLYTRRRILVGLYVCCGMGKDTKKKALRQQWPKLLKCNSIVNLRLNVGDKPYSNILESLLTKKPNMVLILVITVLRLLCEHLHVCLLFAIEVCCNSIPIYSTFLLGPQLSILSSSHAHMVQLRTVSVLAC